MDEERLYQILQPETRDPTARIFRVVHHAMVAGGIGIMLADTVGEWRQGYAGALDAGFQIVCAFFLAEYVLRLAAAPGAPGAAHRGKWQSRLAWATSLGGVFDFLGALPGVLDVVFNPSAASLFGFIWAFKLVRYSQFFWASASFCCWRRVSHTCWRARPSLKSSAQFRRPCGGRSSR